MTLQIRSARISYRGPDTLDITAKSGGLAGHPFAPSWRILAPALEARRIAKRLRTNGNHAEAERVELDAWEAYAPSFTIQMRESYRHFRAEWNAMLARESVCLTCYCAAPKDGPLRCHRVLLAGMLVKLGAEYLGEVE